MHIAATEKRFIVRADEKLTAFVELERVTRESARFPNAEQFGINSPILTNRGIEHDPHLALNSEIVSAFHGRATRTTRRGRAI